MAAAILVLFAVCFYDKMHGAESVEKMQGAESVEVTPETVV